MRISDWSSDVCSSDLRPRTVYPPLRLLDHTHWYVGEDRARIVRRIRRSDRGNRAPPNLLLNEHGRAMTRTLLTAHLAEAFAAACDRKSGVYGKSVSVRADLRGRRFIIKQN